MSLLWVLSLAADCDSDAAKINEYAKELNQKYKLELGDEVGLQFFNFGFCYVDSDNDCLIRAEEMIKEIVAHFPDIKLTYGEAFDGACHQATMISQNGILVDCEPWNADVHCEEDSFEL